MCRSHSEGGRRCPSCTPGTPEYKESRDLANQNRRASRAQRRAFAEEITDRYGDTEQGRALARQVIRTRPSDLPALAAFADQLDPELASAMRESAIEAADGRHLPGVHNQNTMNDRHVSIDGDHYDSRWWHTQDTLRPDPKAINRVVGITSSMTQAYLDSPASEGISTAKRTALEDSAINAKFMSESINSDGSFQVDPASMSAEQRYTLLNSSPEDFMRLGYVEDAIANSQRQAFLENSTAIAEVRPIEHERNLPGLDLNTRTTVNDMVRYMEDNGRDDVTIREGVVLRKDADSYAAGGPLYYFEVDGDEELRLPAKGGARVLSTTGRIPNVTDYVATPGTELDDQHISAERLTSPNTREGREFRKQLNREVIRAAYTTGKDIGNDKRWETVTENRGDYSVTLDKLVKPKTAGKRNAVTAATVANMGLRSVSGSGGVGVESDKVPSVADSAMRASLACQDRAGVRGLAEKTKFRPHGADVTRGTTVHGNKRPARDPKRTKDVGGIFTVASDKDRKHHKAVKEQIGGVMEATSWDKQDTFTVAPDSPVARTFKGRVVENQDVERMVRSANQFSSARDRSVIDRSVAGDALLMERAIKQQRERNMLDDYAGNAKAQTMAVTMRLPKGVNHANVFHEGRAFSPNEHVITTTDGDSAHGPAYGAGEKQVRLVMSTKQGVAMNPDMAVIPKGSQLRVAKRMTDADGVVTVFLVDENDVLDAAGVK